MIVLKPFLLLMGLVLVFAAGLYGGPLARSTYARAFPQPVFASGDYTALYRETGNRVVLFSTSTCPYCKKTRDMLDAKHVAYTDYVIDQSDASNAKFKALGGVAVPVLYIGGRSIRGFREPVIAEALAMLEKTPTTGAQ
jgi:glutaredoxin